MNERKLLIVGIDPGTTIGYAVLDIEGNLLQVESSKQFDLNFLISEIIKLGKVVLVGTDKQKVPNLVGLFATKLGAKVISPQEDLRIEEKRKTVFNYKFEDEHQCDALASAIFAYKSSRQLLDKINFFARENKKEHIKNKIKELVITKGISIKSAVSIIEEKTEEAQITQKAIAEKKLNEADFLKLFEKLRKYENEIKLLRKYNNDLLNRLKNLEENTAEKKPKDSKKVIYFREKRIRVLENLIKNRERESAQYRELSRKFERLIANISNYYILKKLSTLGSKEFGFRNKILNLEKNDIILVDNPNIASSEVIELLKDKVFVIIHKNPVSEKIENNLPFVFVSADSLKIEETKYFGFIDKKHFEAEKNKIDWVKKIMEDYKKEKQLVSQ